MERRTLAELINKEEPGWQLVQEWLSEASNHYEVLPATEKTRDKALLDLQVTTRSPMGAIVYETGGILIDHGWLRILGSGHEKLPRSIPEWNLTAQGLELSDVPFVLIADDVLGGFFALDSGALGDPRKVFYLAPDTVRWENTERGYSDFIWFCLTGNLDDYYTPNRWEGWQEEIAGLNGSQTMSFAPPLFVEPLPQSTQKRSRRPVPVAEAYSFAIDAADQLKDVKDGAVIEIRVKRD